MLVMADGPWSVVMQRLIVIDAKREPIDTLSIAAR